MKRAITAEQCRQLDGKIAVVTGGAQGIGRAIVEHFQQAGAQVCIVDRNVERGQATALECNRSQAGPDVSFVQADLERPEHIRALMQETAQRYSRLDVLVNNAGIEIDAPLAEMQESIWDTVMAVNLRAPLFLAQAMLPLFPASGGAIINISSIHATHAFSDSTAYACSKAGLIALTRNLALETAPLNIRVNAITPGYIDTPLWESFLSRATDPARTAEQVTALHPLGRRGTPMDVAQAALFLATEASSFLTGTQIVVDGGLTIRAHPE